MVAAGWRKQSPSSCCDDLERAGSWRIPRQRGPCDGDNVTYVKAAEDLDPRRRLRLGLSTASTLVTVAILHAPHQTSNITAVKLFFFALNAARGRDAQVASAQQPVAPLGPDGQAGCLPRESLGGQGPHLPSLARPLRLRSRKRLQARTPASEGTQGSPKCLWVGCWNTSLRLRATPSPQIGGPQCRCRPARGTRCLGCGRRQPLRCAPGIRRRRRRAKALGRRHRRRRRQARLPAQRSRLWPVLAQHLLCLFQASISLPPSPSLPLPPSLSLSHTHTFLSLAFPHPSGYLAPPLSGTYALCS